jgi:cytochrome P450
VHLCAVKVPKGTALSISVAMLHRDEEVWARTLAIEFKPSGSTRSLVIKSRIISFSISFLRSYLNRLTTEQIQMKKL